MRSGVQDFLPKPVSSGSAEGNAGAVRSGDSAKRRSARPGQIDRGDGLEGRRGYDDGRREPGRSALRRSHAKRAVLLDFARPLGNVHLLLDLHPRFGIRDAVDESGPSRQPLFRGAADAPQNETGNSWAGPCSPRNGKPFPVPPLERVVNVAQNEFRHGAGGSSVRNSPPSGARCCAWPRMILMVAEANVPALWTLERRLLALKGFGIEPDRTRIIINRWHKGDDEVVEEHREGNKAPVFACLPNDFRKASAAVNLGTPLMENHNNVLTTRYRQLAAQLAGIEIAIPVSKTRPARHCFHFQEEVAYDVPLAPHARHTNGFRLSKDRDSPQADSETESRSPERNQARRCSPRSRSDPRSACRRRIDTDELAGTGAAGAGSAGRSFWPRPAGTAAGRSHGLRHPGQHLQAGLHRTQRNAGTDDHAVSRRRAPDEHHRPDCFRDRPPRGRIVADGGRPACRRLARQRDHSAAGGRWSLPLHPAIRPRPTDGGRSGRQSHV